MGRPVRRIPSWQLFAVCVLVWGSTWHAITYQLRHNTPEVGVALRFGVAAAVVLALCRLRGLPMRFGWRDHALFAFQGVLLYGVSYVCVYHAERHLPSGLVAVGYSASPLLQGVGAALLFGAPFGRRFVGGGLLGIAGVALIFWPEIVRAIDGTGQRSTGLGVIFTVAAVALSAIGSLAASRNRHRGLPFWPALGFGMAYGALAAVVVAAVLGHRLHWPAVASWWWSLAWLSLAGSVLSFACYLSLQDRLGPGPTASVGVMTTLLALVFSLLFEDFRADLLTLAGAALTVAGNTLMLWPPGQPLFRRGDAAATG